MVFAAPARPAETPSDTADPQVVWGYPDGTASDGYELAEYPDLTTVYNEGFEGYEGPCGWPNEACWQAPGSRLWVRGEYLLWWTSGNAVPPLVTTSLDDPDADVAGVLGEADTEILLVGTGLDGGSHSGGRLALTYWLGACQSGGVEASYLALGRSTGRFDAASDDVAILARPVFDTVAAAQAAMLVSYPGLIDGSISVEAATELQAAEALWRSRLFAQCDRRLDVVIGYRFARLDESLRIDHFSEWTQGQGQIIAGTTKDVFDRFDTENQFHGAELGVIFEERVGRWSLELLMKLGLGNSHSRVFIDGATETTVPGAGSATFVGGLLAQETNIGIHERDHIAVVPELGVTLACDLTSRLRATFGYTFLYWNNVARPADQIDLDVSQYPPEPPGDAGRPEFRFTSNDFWAQGMNFGLDYRF